MIEKYYDGDLFKFDNQEQVDQFEKANDIYRLVVLIKGKDNYDALVKAFEGAVPVKGIE